MANWKAVLTCLLFCLPESTVWAGIHSSCLPGHQVWRLLCGWTGRCWYWWTWAPVHHVCRAVCGPASLPHSQPPGETKARNGTNEMTWNQQPLFTYCSCFGSCFIFCTLRLIKSWHTSVSGCDRNYLSSCQTGLNFFRHKFMLVTSIPRERVMGTQRQILTELKHIILPH